MKQSFVRMIGYPSNSYATMIATVSISCLAGWYCNTHDPQLGKIAVFLPTVCSSQLDFSVNSKQSMQYLQQWGLTI